MLVDFAPTTFDIAQMRALFTYDKISTQKRMHDENYMFGSWVQETIFISFGCIGENPEVKAPGGWKLHIAVNDIIPGNVAKAWDSVLNILIEQRICQSKVIKPNMSFMHDKRQCGKQITIYQFFNPSRDWDEIVHQIEGLLHNSAGGAVAEGTFSPADRQIPGSRYISYRNDLNKAGSDVISASGTVRFSEGRRHNPFGRPDPFAGIVIT